MCREGKGRTGFVCALLLAAVGGTPQAIEADDLRSDPVYDPDEIATAIDDHYGGIHQHLQRVGGLDPHRRTGLRELLLDRT